MVASLPDRDPRWARTRRSLLDGGRRVMARKGVEAASVAEIVREAGVSQPSFYNHFDSKEELAEEIVVDFFRSDVAFKHRVFELVDDPAEAIAINTRHTLHVATRDPIVAQLIVHGGTGRNLLRISDSDELADMIAEGIRLGRFAQLNPRVAALLIRGAGFPLLQEILKGNAPATIESDFAELVLRMLGVPPEEAADIAGRPDPVLNGESDQPPEYENTAES